MNRPSHSTSTFLALAAAAMAMHSAAAEGSINLWTGEGATIGRVLVPQLTLTTAFGASTAPEGSLAMGHHDPDRDGFTLQNAELALTAQLSSNLTATGLYAAKVDLDDHWEDEFEEYYLAYSAFEGALRIKGGRFFTQFGYQNTLHPHDFTFVDQYLANGRMLGEDAATIYGVEISTSLISRLPNRWSDRLTISFGAVPDGHEEHHHGHELEAAFEGELAAFNDVLGTAEYRVTHSVNETTQYAFGIAGAWGKNQFERTTQVYGLHFERLWKATAEKCDHKAHQQHSHHGHDHGTSGEFLRWRSEVLLRHFGAVGGAHDEHEEHAGHEEENHLHDAHEDDEPSAQQRKSFTDVGFYSALTYGLPGGTWQGQLRGEYVSGIDEAGLAERWRVSPAISWTPSDRLPINLKLQYNWDHLPGQGDEHSVWLQVKFQWGEEGDHEH